jgi:hypothetical protein
MNAALTELRALRTPERIQAFLDALPINHEKRGETCFSPASVLRKRKAHCLEGALLAATALMLAGERPLLMNLMTGPGDDDHAVALFRRNGLWGALSKTNHAVLRYRDPIYRTPRELALSYFHEYFLGTTGRKTLRAYSLPFNLRRFGTRWTTSEKDLWPIAYALRGAPHLPIAPKKALANARRASAFERAVMEHAEWKRSDKRT